MPLILAFLALTACSSEPEPAGAPTADTAAATPSPSTPTANPGTTAATADTGTVTAPTGLRVCSDPSYYAYTLDYVYWRDEGATDDGIRYVVDPSGPCYDLELPPGAYEVRAEAVGCTSSWVDATVTAGTVAEVVVPIQCFG